MALENTVLAVPKFVQWLRRFARVSAWLLLVVVVLLVLSGWGITRTEIIYKATFGLVDRRLADSFHRIINLPMAVFFLTHVLINIRLAITTTKPALIRLVNTLIIIVGVALMALFVYVEYFTQG